MGSNFEWGGSIQIEQLNILLRYSGSDGAVWSRVCCYVSVHRRPRSEDAEPVNDRPSIL